MGVLHVPDRVVLRLFQHLVEIEVQRRVVLPRQHDKAGHVGARLFHHVAQGDKGPCPLRHLEGLAVLEELDQLDELDLQGHPAFGQRRDSRLHALDIAAMIRAPDVDQEVETAFDLVVVIGDVGGEIGPGPVRLLHRAVLIVAELGGAEKGLLAFLPVVGKLALRRLQLALIDKAKALQPFQRRLDPAGAVEGLLRRIDVHLDAEQRKILADHLHHRGGGIFAHIHQPDRFRLV